MKTPRRDSTFILEVYSAAMNAEELADLPLFDDLRPEQLERLAPLFRRAHFLADDHVFDQGDAALDAFVLESGEVAIRLYLNGGDCLDIATIGPGCAFGWSAVLGRSRYTSSAVCLTPVQTIAIRGSDLRGVINADPELGTLLLERMAQVVASRLDGLREQLIRLMRVETEP